MSDDGSSDVCVEHEDELYLSSVTEVESPTAHSGSSNRTFFKAVARQQQDTTKTCRLLALEVGSLRAELNREHKKRLHAVTRATNAEAAQQQAEQRLHELQYSMSKLQQELTAMQQAGQCSSKRIKSLSLSLVDAGAEAQKRAAQGHQQVQQLTLAAETLRSVIATCFCSNKERSSNAKGAQLVTQLTQCLVDALAQLDETVCGCTPDAATSASMHAAGVVTFDDIIQRCQRLLAEHPLQDPEQVTDQDATVNSNLGGLPPTSAGALSGWKQQQQMQAAKEDQQASRHTSQQQKDTSQVQQQLASMQQLCAESNDQLQQLRLERLVTAQQLAAAQAEIARLKAEAEARRAFALNCMTEVAGRETMGAIDGLACKQAGHLLPKQQQQQAYGYLARQEPAASMPAHAESARAPVREPGFGHGSSRVTKSATEMTSAFPGPVGTLQPSGTQQDSSQAAGSCPHAHIGLACLPDRVSRFASVVTADVAGCNTAFSGSRLAGAGASSSSAITHLGATSTTTTVNAAAARGAAQTQQQRHAVYSISANAGTGNSQQGTAAAASGADGRPDCSIALHASGGFSIPHGSSTSINDNTNAAACRHPVLKSSSNTFSAAAAAATVEDRYKLLAQEADAALQRLAACKRMGQSAGAVSCVAAGHLQPRQQEPPSQAVACLGSRPVCESGSDSLPAIGCRPGSADLASHTRRVTGLKGAQAGSVTVACGLSTIPTVAGSRSGSSPSAFTGRCSPRLSPAAKSAGMCPPSSISGIFTGFGGKSCWSPSRVAARGSPTRWRLSPQASASVTTGQRVQGERQALDSDIAAAEAALQLAAERLGAAGGQHT